MKKLLTQRNITIMTMAVGVFVFLVFPLHVSHAQVALNVNDSKNWLVSGITAALQLTALPILGIASHLIFALSSIVLSVCGAILNGSLYLTINLKNIVEATPAIETTWRVIRDFSSIFFIGALLYASIMTILGAGNSSLGTVIKNIVMAGLLINFSLFGTKVVIDASNLVSLSFYRAMMPEGAKQTTDYVDITTKPDWFKAVFDDGGISDMVMQSLKLQSIGDLAKNILTLNVDYKVIIGTFFGAIIMLVVAVSFLTAGIMFVIRTGILLLLLAFSPIYLVAMILPQAKEYSDEWRKMLIGQCLFPIVYLMIMYVGFTILSSANFQTALGTTSATFSGAIFKREGMGIFVQYVLILMVINGALVAAMSAAAKGSKGFEKLVNNVKGFALRNTAGLAASRLNSSESMRRFYANNPNVGMLASKALSTASGAAYGGTKGGYDAAFKKRKKDLEKFNKDIGSVDRGVYSSDSEFKAAEKRGEAYQAKHRIELNKSGILSYMIADRRANIATSGELRGKARKEELKKAKKENQKKLSSINEEINGKRQEISKLEGEEFEGVGLSMREISPGKKAANQTRIEQLKKEIAGHQAKADTIQKDIDDAEKAEGQDAVSELAKKLASEGGDEKPEKKEEKSEEKK